jgi:hypothetical protein
VTNVREQTDNPLMLAQRAQTTGLYGQNDLIAQGTDRYQVTASKQPENTSGIEVANHAKALGKQHEDWWRNEGPHGKIRKCNLFADRVFRDLHIQLPWDSKHVPTVHNMIPKLANSSDWLLVYTHKQSQGLYHSQPGDFALWDTTIHSTKYGHPWSYALEHCGIIGNNGAIHYAGSMEGYREANFKALCSTKTFTYPIVIYRSKHVHH